MHKYYMSAFGRNDIVIFAHYRIHFFANMSPKKPSFGVKTTFSLATNAVFMHTVMEYEGTSPKTNGCEAPTRNDAPKA